MVREYKVALVLYADRSIKGITSILTRLKVDYRVVLPNEIPNFTPTHIILYEGTEGSEIPKWVLDSTAPVLGIGYGMIMIARYFRATIRPTDRESEPTEITEIVDGYQTTGTRWMNKRARIISLPANFRVMGVTPQEDIASFTDNRRWWGFQYYPEFPGYQDYDVFKRFLGKV